MASPRIMALMLALASGPAMAQQATSTGDQSPAVVAGGNVTINYQGMSAAEKEAFAKQVADKLLEDMKAGGGQSAGPGAGQQVGEAVSSIAKGAAEGDARLQQALALLAAGKVNEATPLLRAVAQEKGEQSRKTGKEAATAYRNLGAIAGLRDPTAALDAYAKAASLDPDDAESQIWAGDLEVDHGELASAEARFTRVLTLASKDSWYLLWARLRLGDIRQYRGDLSEALKIYRNCYDIAEKRAQSDPGSAEWQRDLSVCDNRIGNVLVVQGDLPGALASYRDGLAIVKYLAQSDPGNAGWQRNLSVFDDKIGDVLVAQGDVPGALAFYRDGLAIATHLAQSDLGNTEWQRDLSMSDNKIGDVLVAQGDLPGALASYRDGLAIAKHLAQSDPGNAWWQRDLSVSDNRIGDVLVAQGDLQGALAFYRDGLAIATHLAQSDPGNAEWQFDLVVSNWGLAHAGDDAAARWAAIVESLRAMKAANRLSPTQARYLPQAESELAKIRQNKP